MRRHLVPLALLATPLAVTAVGCNCGRPVTMMTMASVTLPVEVLDFGVVPEGTSKRANFQVENVGRAPIKVTITIDPERSQEFVLGQFSDTIEAGGSIDVPVTFTPVGSGSDEGAALIATEGQDMPLTMNLKGGPIEPRLAFIPNPLAFGDGGVGAPLERRYAKIRSVGTSALNVRSVGIVPTANPNFAIVPPMLPAKLLPDETLDVLVEYTRTARNDTGFMEVLSDDADGGRNLLELFPDPPTVCTDRVDNDGDGLIDFPQDPGCQDAADETEDNAAQCVNGIMQPCDIGACAFAGMRTCANSIWGQCMGTCDAGVPDAGMPDAGQPDSGTSCNPIGTYYLDAGSIQYECCDYFGTGIISVQIDINRFQIQANSVRPLPDQPYYSLPASMQPMCPNGTFTYTRTESGGCDETYTLTGTFAGPDTFVGTYSVQFSGSQCTGAECGGLDCVDQTWNISAGR